MPTNELLELIGKQQFEIDNLRTRIKSLETCVHDIKVQMICVGGPLNDNFLKYTKEQSYIFYRFQELIDGVVG